MILLIEKKKDTPSLNVLLEIWREMGLSSKKFDNIRSWQRNLKYVGIHGHQLWLTRKISCVGAVDTKHELTRDRTERDEECSTSVMSRVTFERQVCRFNLHWSELFSALEVQALTLNVSSVHSGINCKGQYAKFHQIAVSVTKWSSLLGLNIRESTRFFRFSGYKQEEPRSKDRK